MENQSAQFFEKFLGIEKETICSMDNQMTNRDRQDVTIDPTDSSMTFTTSLLV